jgi:nucleoside phosphorylase
MDNGHNPKLRFGLSLQQARSPAFRPVIANGPPLPAVNFAQVGQTAPKLLPTPAGTLPQARAVVITWANAEWAALEHVFCAGASAMPYSNQSKGTWPGWEKYAANLPAGAPSDWTFWGECRLVEINGSPVLLFKSNTHLDWPGSATLEAMIDLLITQVQPKVILSIGTAGGTKTQDHIGTVRAVSAATLYETSVPPASWPEYKSNWRANDTTLGSAGFGQLLFPVPSKASDLQALCDKFNQHYATNYALSELDPDGLNMGDAKPQVADQTADGSSLLTTSTFVVATSAGNFQQYSSIEMDDAIIGRACASRGMAFGSVRNVSDPVQNAALPARVQGSWGSTVYDAYGFYTSYNGALAAWAMLA